MGDYLDKVGHMSLAVEDPSGLLGSGVGGRERPRLVKVAGRALMASPVFDTYWGFAAERQATFLRRQAGLPGPWTTDPVIRAHRFTNCYRATDRVSQYLIRHVIYAGDQAPGEVVFRVLLFKFFNKIGTWEALESAFGELTLRGFDSERYAEVLAGLAAQGASVYSAAYVMPSPRMGFERKFRNHLALLEYMLRDGLTGKLQRSATMRQAFEVLRGYPGLGDFLAFQYLIDLNYSEVLDFDEMSYVVAGPGARSGLRKVFGLGAVGVERDLIALMADGQEQFLASLGLAFHGLVNRPLQLIDCQNLFCEVDKYARVSHPEISGGTSRHRIKQRYSPAADPPASAFFPPKWDTRVPEVDIYV